MSTSAQKRHILESDKARNEIFNISNGDVYRWSQVWEALADFYDPKFQDRVVTETRALLATVRA